MRVDTNTVAARGRSWLIDVSTQLRKPVVQADLLQVLKTVVAAVVAWAVSVHLGSQQPFLAPWAALLTVHATVYRTLSRGAQAVAATGVGVVLAFLVATGLGLGAAALGVALLVGLLLARLGVLRAEGVTIATTALFVLTAGYAQHDVALVARVAETALGVAVGLAVNILVLPPLNNRSAAQHIDDLNRRLGRLLHDMAAELRDEWNEERSGEWIERTRQIDRELDHAWEVVRHARESTWWNPRYRFSRRVDDPARYQDVLSRLEDGIAQARSMARTIHESTASTNEWDPRFREPWLDLLSETGQRVADPHADVHPLHERADDLTQELSGQDLPGLLWPVYGALISNLINVIDVVDDVASAQPVRT